MQALKVLLISDGIPGHSSRSHGLVCWLSDYVEVSYDICTVKLRFAFFSRLALKFLLNYNVAPFWLVKYFYDFSKINFDLNYDIIVSAGGKTSFLNASLARSFNLYNIYFGSLRGLRPDLFNLHATMYNTFNKNNYVMDIPPTCEGFISTSSLDYDVPEDYSLLVFGGNGDGQVYSAYDIDRFLIFLDSVHQLTKRKWCVATSRRSGVLVENAFEKFFVKNKIGKIFKSDDINGVDLRNLMINSSKIFVTNDSFTMLTESLVSQKPVTILDFGSGAISEHNLSIQNNYLNKNYCTRICSSDIYVDDLSSNININSIKDDFIKFLFDDFHSFRNK